MSMLKIWGGVFWGKEPEPRRPVDEPHPEGGCTTVLVRPKVPTSLLLPGVVLAATTLCIGLGATVLLDLSATAAANLLDTSTYVEAVLG